MIMINFRGKFKNFYHSLTDSQQKAIGEFFIGFLNYSKSEAILFLWKLTYQTEDYVLNKLGIPNTASTVKLFRNELRFQYERHVKCLAEIPANCKNQFEELERVSDKITAIRVFGLCKSRMFDPSSIDRAIHLLSFFSDNEKYVFGGLRTLDFSYEEADYLKAFGKEIYELILAVRAKYESTQPTSSPESSEASIPSDSKCEYFSNDEEVNKELTTSDSCDTPEPSADYELTEKDNFSLENIRENKIALRTFITACEVLEKNGLSPSKVISNKIAISKILEGLSELQL